MKPVSLFWALGAPVGVIRVEVQFLVQLKPIFKYKLHENAGEVKMDMLI